MTEIHNQKKYAKNYYRIMTVNCIPRAKIRLFLGPRMSFQYELSRGSLLAGDEYCSKRA